MTRPATDTRVRILDIAERLVMQRGYHAFSYQHIADELGIRGPAVNYHFRTKPALVEAVLDRYRERFERWADRHADGDPAARLDAYLDLSRGFVAAERVCALGMMSSDFNVVPERVQGQTRELQATIFGWCARLLDEGREAGVFTFDGPADAKAAEVVCAALGSQQLGRVRGPEAFEQVAAQIRRSLGLS